MLRTEVSWLAKKSKSLTSLVMTRVGPWLAQLNHIANYKNPENSIKKKTDRHEHFQSSFADKSMKNRY